MPHPWRLPALAFGLSLALAPFAFAHTDGGLPGTPKTYCESVLEWNVHEYGPATVVVPKADWDGYGNGLAGYYWLVHPYGHVGVWLDPEGEPEVPPRVASRPMTAVEGNLSDCDMDGIAPDHDLHYEFGAASTFLASGASVGWDEVWSGSEECWGVPAHHVSFPPIYVEDLVLGSTVEFYVTADIEDWAPFPPQDGFEIQCGDGVYETWIACFGYCIVPFPPGLDGSYGVYVDLNAVQGHVYTN